MSKSRKHSPWKSVESSTEVLYYIMHLLHFGPVLHLGPGSARRESTCLAQIATTDSAHLHDSNAELINQCYADSAMGRGPEDSAAPATASLAAAQQQKPKTVFRRAECKELCAGGGKNAVERT